MSESPIKAWRDSWKPPAVSTPQSTAVHAVRDGRAYCGRRSKMLSVFWEAVTCADCKAARAADSEPHVSDPGGTETK